jgi:hypothetical protein
MWEIYVKSPPLIDPLSREKISTPFPLKGRK